MSLTQTEGLAEDCEKVNEAVLIKIVSLDWVKMNEVALFLYYSLVQY